ncbi:exopolysaccharide biosynthesis polyprenyl glycosylphosphotransferase [Nonlabens marinus]|uniref:Bacterial sugar transferase n=1 Tax=Nonlabens marinus S1-08 TaxID=1454201 RepID=W8VXD9_9FLAO|nr:exopolysaccharide biosynthesis polyprenyl glycosylphosphotransferase [Nonlabens marinus]BAO55757.1 bacterial sugar transferase [Nonlabens marinus S1-08]
MTKTGSIHFEISERKILLRIIDISVVLLAVNLIGILFDLRYFKIDLENWEWSVMLGFYIFFFANVFELYDLKKASRINSTLRSVTYTASLTALAYLLTPYLTPTLPDNRLQILYFFVTITGSLMIWRAIYIKLFASSRFNKRIIIVADAVDAVDIAQSLQEADPNYFIEGYINTDASVMIGHDDRLPILSMEEAMDKLNHENVSEIVIASANVEGITPAIYSWLIELVETGYSVREYTQVYEEMTDRVPVSFVGKDFYRYFPFARSNQNQLYRVYHRTFDILVSLVGVLLGLLILPIVVLGNILGNRGSLFYTQVRVGRNRKEFKIIKFRTMVMNAEKDGAQFTVKRDVRVTFFGNFLRKTRIDEFPQFFNILKGEMSVIGPRPERPVFVKTLTEKIPFYETRHIVKPGLTGWAQVKANYGESYEDHLRKLQYDLFYIKKRSIFLDIRILVKTLSTVIFFKGQ